MNDGRGRYQLFLAQCSGALFRVLTFDETFDAESIDNCG
jgi:hypothetical protein